MAPEFEDIVREAVEIGDEAADLICRVDEARVLAAYYQGRAECLEALNETLMAERNETIAYLKDRLNRAEARPRVAPKEGE